MRVTELGGALRGGEGRGDQSSRRDLGDWSQAFPALRFAHLRRASSVPGSLQTPLRGCAVLKGASVTIAHAQERGEGDGRWREQEAGGFETRPYDRLTREPSLRPFFRWHDRVASAVY